MSPPPTETGRPSRKPVSLGHLYFFGQTLSYLCLLVGSWSQFIPDVEKSRSGKSGGRREAEPPQGWPWSRAEDR